MFCIDKEESIYIFKKYSFLFLKEKYDKWKRSSSRQAEIHMYAMHIIQCCGFDNDNSNNVHGNALALFHTKLNNVNKNVHRQGFI